MFHIILLTLLTAVNSRDLGMRAVPGVRDSIINLGKMDVSFYMNAKPEDFSAKNDIDSDESAKPCPCSHSMNDDPHRFVDKMMSHGSHHQEPAFSTKCCEQKGIHEDIIFTFTPKKHPKLSNLPEIPFPINLLMNSENLKLPVIPERNKVIELFLFPKRKDVEANRTTKALNDSKNGIKFVTEDVQRDSKKIDSPPVPLVINNLDANTDKGTDIEIKKNKEEKTDKINM